MTNTHPAYWKKACKALSKADPVMADIIQRYKGELLKPRGDAFYTLARAIVGQQISVKAAQSVWNKVEAFLGRVEPEIILVSSPDGLRACGLSGQKVVYLKSLAQHFTDNPHPNWSKMTDEEAIKWLTVIKGIGRWSAEMFLIFNLLRPDVFPLDDIGLQKGIERAYNKSVKTTKKQMEKLGKLWHPFRSVATWYLWRSLDPVPVEY